MTWTPVNEFPFGRDLSVRHLRLHNGLALLLVVDPSAPIFSYQTWFRVGSRHEQPGRTGMAHLFEHLMFNQTQHLAAGELDRRIEAVGGDSNAATWVDWTYYRTSLPASQLALAVELESDRMQHLLLDDAQLEAEREVVINERMQRVDDDVEGFLDEQLMKLAFSEHPYRWPTIGWMEDIRAIAKPDVHAFYRTYYAPNNATIVLVGDVDAGAALAAIERGYGDIPAAEIPAPAAVVELAQTGERVARFAKPVPADRLLVGYRSPAQSHPDWAVLEVIASLLTGGPSARLYERLVVDTQVASSCDGFVLPFRDPSLFELSIAIARGHDAAEALTEVDDAAARLCDEPVPEDELAKVKNGAETDFWTPLSTGDGKADALGHYHSTLGDYRLLFRAIDELRAVTAADVMRVAAKYLDSSQRTIVLAEPGVLAEPSA
jgi:zinc protease